MLLFLRATNRRPHAERPDQASACSPGLRAGMGERAPEALEAVIDQNWEYLLFTRRRKSAQLTAAENTSLPVAYKSSLKSER